MKATERLIDSVWTVEYEIVSDEDRYARQPKSTKYARILNFNREDPEGYEKEKELPRCNLIEGDDRTVIALVISPYDSFKYRASMTESEAEFYLVVNPKHVFSYKS